MGVWYWTEATEAEQESVRAATRTSAGYCTDEKARLLEEQYAKGVALKISANPLCPDGLKEKCTAGIAPEEEDLDYILAALDLKLYVLHRTDDSPYKGLLEESDVANTVRNLGHGSKPVFLTTRRPKDQAHS